MAQSSDITSTEKLLNVIRGKTPAPPATPAPEAPKPKADPVKPLLKFKASSQKSTTVGIDIGHEYLRLVKAAESGGKWRIIARRRLPLPARTSRDMPEFSAFLKASLSSFCGSPDQSNLWAIISTAAVELRPIRIPKVPKKQIANAVYWMAKKEMPFNEKETVFDFEVRGEVIEQGIPKLSVMAYTAPQKDVEELKNFFSRIGWPLTGVSIVPFATQNLLRSGWIPALEGSVASLYIGNDFSRIDIYNGGNLVMTRGIKSGTRSMVEAIIESADTLKQGPQAPPLTMEQGRKVINSLGSDSPPLDPSDYGFGLPKSDVFDMIEPALERLVRQVERTFEHYMTMAGSEGLSRIFVSGAIDISPPLVDYIGSQLGVKSAGFDPLSAQGQPVPCPDVNDALNVSERAAFAPALGLSMSDNALTPNLIFTSSDKEKQASVALVNKAIFATFFVLVLICAAVLVYQGIDSIQKKDGIAKLEVQLAQLGPSVDRPQLQQMVARVNQQRQLSKVYADRYLGMVLISELAALTPANIRLVDMKINLRPATSATTAAAPAKIEDVTVEGLVFGERQSLESSLAGYALLLEASPLLQQVTIQKNTVGPYLKGEALHFIINMKVEAQVHG